MFALELAPGGIVLSHWDKETRTHVREVVRPTNMVELMRFWHYSVDAIVPGFTVGDLFGMLGEIENPAELSPLLSCDVEAFMEEAKKGPSREMDGEVKAIIVTNQAWSQYDDESDGSEPLGSFQEKFVIAREVHGRGTFQEPYEGYFLEHPEDLGKEGSYALDFSPVGDLLELPLEYRPELIFAEKDGLGAELFKTSIGISFGELVMALFWEIGFHGGPANRDAQMESLEEAVREVDEINEELNDAAVYLRGDDLDAKREELGLHKMDVDEMMEDVRRERENEAPQLRGAKHILSRFGASIAKTKGVVGVAIEGKDAAARVVVFVTSPDLVVEIPQNIEGFRVDCRVVERFEFNDEDE